MDRTYANKSSIDAKRMEDGEEYFLKTIILNYEFIKG